MFYHTFWSFIKKLSNGYSKNKIPTVAAALAYYTLFSIAPILFMVISIVGNIFGEETVKLQISSQIDKFTGAETANLIMNLLGNISKPVTGVIAYITSIILLIIGATGIFSEIQNGLNSIWGVKAPKHSSWITMLKFRFLSFILVVAIGLLFMVFMVLSIILTAINHYLVLFFQEMEIITVFLSHYLISSLVATLLFAILFKVLPDVKLKWRDVWLGAFITMILFTFGKLLIGFYVVHTNISSVYGVSSAVIVLLIWVFYSAQIFFIGAEITKIFASNKGK